MKNTRILTTLGAASVLAFAACNKQEPQAGVPPHGPGGPGGPERPAAGEEGGPGGARLKEALGLTDEQAEKLKTIREEERAKLEALRKETRAKLEGVLNKEQIARMEEFRERRLEGGRPGGPDGRLGERVLERMKTDLALTDEQVKKIEAVFKKQREAALALRKDEASKPVDREQLRSLRDSTKTQIDAILTPEQRAKMAELRDRRPVPGEGPAHKEGKRPRPID
jgi:Spy/CpxP family protein refolding chaperone